MLRVLDKSFSKRHFEILIIFFSQKISFHFSCKLSFPVCVGCVCVGGGGDGGDGGGGEGEERD